MTCSPSSPPVFCDSLDVTFAPGDFPFPELNALLLDTGFVCLGSLVDSTRTYRSPDQRGTVRLEQRGTFSRASTSGSSCAHLRASGAWLDYLAILGSSPHSVTRLDAAIDLAMDGADLVDSMRSRYQDGFVSLGRKAIRTSVILGIRPDGRESGSWYAGYGSSAKATAKVYDKALQLLDRYGESVPPRARVEVTAKKGYGATLRDAALPDAIFWHIAAPALLKAPEGVPMWKPDTDGGWQSERRELVPAQVLTNRIENSAELDAFIALAQSFQGGMGLLRHLLNKRISAAESSEAETA